MREVAFFRRFLRKSAILGFAAGSYLASGCSTDESKASSGSSTQFVQPRGLNECARIATDYAETQRGKCGNNCVYGRDSDHHAIAVREFARCMACQAPTFRNAYGSIYGNFGEFAAWYHENGAKSPDWLTDNDANRGGLAMAREGFKRSMENLYLKWETKMNLRHDAKGNCGSFQAPFPVHH